MHSGAISFSCLTLSTCTTEHHLRFHLFYYLTCAYHAKHSLLLSLLLASSHLHFLDPRQRLRRRPNYHQPTYLMTYLPVYLIFAVSLFAISTANGNYGYDQQRTVCDRGAYDRAQNTIRLEMNSPRGVVQSGQPPYNQPYSGQNSGMTNSYQGNSQQQIDQQCR